MVSYRDTPIYIYNFFLNSNKGEQKCLNSKRGEKIEMLDEGVVTSPLHIYI